MVEVPGTRLGSVKPEGQLAHGPLQIYDSPEAMKKFEPLYRLVRVGMGKKVERPSRQQRTYRPRGRRPGPGLSIGRETDETPPHRQATQEPPEDAPGYCEGEGCQGQEGEIVARFRLGIVGGGWDGGVALTGLLWVGAVYD